MSSATKDPFRSGYYRSIGFGIMITPNSTSKIAFLKDENIKRRQVGITCESCRISDCAERVAPPKTVEKKIRFAQTDEVVQGIFEKYK
jgi:predicted transcriptional regulator